MIRKQFRYWVSVGILGLLLTSCTSHKSPVVSAQETSGVFELDSRQYAVLKYQKDWRWIFKAGEPSNLSKSELDQIEGILNKCVNDRNQQYQDGSDSKKYFGITLEDKFRQYVSVLDRNDEKHVWVNFFCNPLGGDRWKNEIFEVHDGGNCHFNVKINLTQKTYYDLMVNGYA